MTRPLLRWFFGIVAFATALAISTTAAAATPDKRATILVVGDSISAAYGLPSGTGWVAVP